MALDCRSDDKTCEDVRTFVMHELRTYYVFKYLPPCPPEDDNGSAWLQLWVGKRKYDNVCKSSGMKKDVCTAGKIQVRSSKEDCTIVSHATVLGCASAKLVDILAANIIMKNSSCHEIPNLKGITQESGIRHEMTLKHCNIPGAICNHKAYCANVTHAVVRVWNEGEELIVCPMKTGTKIAIIAGVVGGVMLIGIGICICLFVICRKRRNRYVLGNRVMEIVDCSTPLGWQR